MSVIAYLSRNSYGQSAEVTHAWLKLAGHFNMESTVAFMTERTVQSPHDIKHCGEKTAISHKCLPWESSHAV